MDWVLISALGVVLVGLWGVATWRHRRARAPRAREWEGAHGRADLWTSGARCPRCQAVGGLIEPQGDGGAVFTCMACGARHARTDRA